MKKKNIWHDDSQPRGKSLTEFVETVWQDLQGVPVNSLERPVKNLPTGLPNLDQRTGGLRMGSLTVIGGRPGMGSTSLALTIAYNVAFEQEKSVLIFSLAFDGEETARRILSNASKVPRFNLHDGNLDETHNAHLKSAVEQLRKVSVHIDDEAFGLPEIRRSIELLITRGASPDLVIIDDLKILAPDICAVKQTEATIRALKRLARETGAAVILPAHFSRRVEKRELKQPLWRDLPGGVITGGADVVLSVLREECYDPDSTRKGTADICVMRNRHGNVGMLELSFDGDCGAFK